MSALPGGHVAVHAKGFLQQQDKRQRVAAGEPPRSKVARQRGDVASTDVDVPRDDGQTLARHGRVSGGRLMNDRRAHRRAPGVEMPAMLRCRGREPADSGRRTGSGRARARPRVEVQINGAGAAAERQRKAR